MNYSHPSLPRRFDDSAAMFRGDYKLTVIHTRCFNGEFIASGKVEREKECRFIIALQ